MTRLPASPVFIRAMGCHYLRCAT